MFERISISYGGSDMCKVSIIMPLYNAEKYVMSTIQSLLNQTYQDFEIIVVDDCSTDNSVEIIKKLDDTRIKLYRNSENCGIAYTRNRALELSRGEYIAIMDDDDIAPDYRLMDEVEYLDNHQDVDVISGNTCIIDEAGNVIGMFSQIYRNSGIIKASLMFLNSFGNSTAMIRKKFIDKYHIRYLNDMFGTEDYRFWAECSVHGKIAALDKVMLYWRKHENESKRTSECIERKIAIQNTQKYLLEQYGYVFSEKEYKSFFRLFAEEARLESEEDIRELYSLLKNIVQQTKDLKLENYEETKIFCRKIFGKKCTLAFFLWD